MKNLLFVTVLTATIITGNAFALDWNLNGGDMVTISSTESVALENLTIGISGPEMNILTNRGELNVSDTINMGESGETFGILELWEDSVFNCNDINLGVAADAIGNLQVKGSENYIYGTLTMTSVNASIAISGGGVLYWKGNHALELSMELLSSNRIHKVSESQKDVRIFLVTINSEEWTKIDAPYKAYFEDVNLKAAVEEALGITDPTYEDLLGLTTLDASNRNISSLYYALQKATNLVELDLSDNNLSNIDELAFLTALESCNLSGNSGITDISAVTSLPLLMELYIGESGITSTTPVAGMTSLVILDLHGLPISDIGDLSTFSSLGTLWIYDMDLDSEDYSDLQTVIANNPSLSDLRTDFIELPGIFEDTTLQSAVIAEFVISHPTTQDMASITTFDVSNSEITSLVGMEFATNLTDPNFANNDITNIESISNLASAGTVDLTGNPLGTMAYCIHIPAMENDPNTTVLADPNPNPLTSDCAFDLSDLATLATEWLDTNCDATNNWCGGSDMNLDSSVNNPDFSIAATLWGNSGIPMRMMGGGESMATTQSQIAEEPATNALEEVLDFLYTQKKSKTIIELIDFLENPLKAK